MAEPLPAAELGQIPSLPSASLVLPAAEETRLSTMQVKHEHCDWWGAAGSLWGDASSAAPAL